MKLKINPHAEKLILYDKYPDVLTSKQAREILGIGRVSLYHLIDTQQIQAFRIGRVYQIPKRELLEYIKMQKECN